MISFILLGYLITRNPDFLKMFSETYVGIKRFVQLNEWFGDVDMFSGKQRRHRVENLHAFWAGMESMMGFTESSSKQLNGFYAIWNKLGFLPEEVDEVSCIQSHQLHLIHLYFDCSSNDTNISNQMF